MPNWGAIVVGGIGGLCGTVVVVVPLLLSGLVDSNTFAGQAVVVLVGFAAQVLAGALASAWPANAVRFMGPLPA